MPPHPDDGSPLFQLARTVLQQAYFSLDVHIEEPERIIHHYDRVQHLLQTLIRLSTADNPGLNVNAWIHSATEMILTIQERLHNLQEYGYDEGDDEAAIRHALTIKFTKVGTNGRSLVSIPWDIITAYRQSNHTWTQIANIFDMSPRTLHRYRIRDAYNDPSPYSAVDDQHLDDIVRRIVDQTSGVIGSQFMLSALHDQGHKVPRRRVR